MFKQCRSSVFTSLERRNNLHALFAISFQKCDMAFLLEQNLPQKNNPMLLILECEFVYKYIVLRSV